MENANIDDTSNNLVHIDETVDNLVHIDDITSADNIVVMDETADYIVTINEPSADNLIMVEDEEMEDDDVFTTTEHQQHPQEHPQQQPRPLHGHPEDDNEQISSSEYSVLNNNYALDLSPSSRFLLTFSYVVHLVIITFQIYISNTISSYFILYILH